MLKTKQIVSQLSFLEKQIKFKLANGCFYGKLQKYLMLFNVHVSITEESTTSTLSSLGFQDTGVR